jgi:8-oxo-dGTP diphosphatase
MMSIPDGFTLELIPHCASVPPDGWTADHDIRPLSEVGLRQASALPEALGTGFEAIYSSPALRCLQTVRPLAAAAGLPVTELAPLRETAMFAEPRQWTQVVYRPVSQAIGGGWSAGLGLRALTTMASLHPRGRVVASSHGDIIPVLLAMLCAACDAPLPKVAARGGWYTLRFDQGTFTVAMRGKELVPRSGDQPGKTK